MDDLETFPDVANSTTTPQNIVNSGLRKAAANSSLLRTDTSWMYLAASLQVAIPCVHASTEHAQKKCEHMVL